MTKQGMSGAGMMYGTAQPMGYMHRKGALPWMRAQAVGDYEGQGVMSAISSIGKKLKSVGSRAISAASGEVGTALSNLAPSSDANARPQYVGEKHAILQLPNGKFGRANFMGPGTQIEKRLARGDPPRTLADKVAQAHDLRYGIAKSQADVARADQKMVDKLNAIQKAGTDKKANILAGKLPIMAKIAGEKSGLIKSGSLASFGDADTPAIRSALAKLEQEGFGKGGAMAPGDALKMQLLKQLGKASKKGKKSKKRSQSAKGAGSEFTYSAQSRGDGVFSTLKNIATHPITKKLAKLAFNKLMPIIMKKIEGKGLRLAGQGLSLPGGAMNKKLIKHVASMASAPSGMGKRKKGKGADSESVKRVAEASAKVMLPLLAKMSKGSMGSIPEKKKAMLGSGLEDLLFKGLSFLWDRFKKSAKQEKFDPRSAEQYNRGIRSQADLDRLAKKGNGMHGEGFWQDFGEGFIKGFTGTMKVAAPLLKMLV